MTMTLGAEFLTRRSSRFSTFDLSIPFLIVFVCLCASISSTVSAQGPPQAGSSTAASAPQLQVPEQGGLQAEQGAPGTISGQIVDTSGAAIVGAHVRLTRDGQPFTREELADPNGQFTFAEVPPGPFTLVFSSSGFAMQTFTSVLRPGEVNLVPMVQLQVATAVTELRVSGATQQEQIAEAQIQDQEKQRVFGVIPNFYVSYDPNAVALRPKQKFELAWKTTLDPVSFVLVGVGAAIQQSQNTFGGYGQGADGYAKRYGAGFADFVTGTFIGSAILPSLLKQDPRYFYKGTGSKRSRALYAIANSVICKGDNGHWQANYSALLGSLAAGGISNLYYPESDRDATVTFENTLIAIGSNAANNILQEFVIRKFTRNAPTYTTAASATRP